MRVEQIGDATLYLGDCTRVLRSTGERFAIGAVLTDPPYGISHSTSRGASWEGTKIANDHDTSARDFILEWADDLPWASFGSWKAPAPVAARACLVWDKGPAFGMGDLSFPWKPSWEHIYIGGEGWSGARDEGVLRGPPVVSWESRGRCHPHEKPAWLFETLTKKLPSVRTILDPFMGTGPAGVACVRLGRRFVGIEIEPKYFDIACRRIEAATKEPRLPLPEPKAKQEAML